MVAVSLKKKIFFKQKTAYEITYGDWSSDGCSADLAFIERVDDWFDSTYCDIYIKVDESLVEQYLKEEKEREKEAEEDSVMAEAADAGEA